VFEGRTIGFCCAGCVGRWSDMSYVDREAFVARCMGRTGRPSSNPASGNGAGCTCGCCR
jgi:hypothetical protein